MKVVYLHGFASGPASNKARFFADRLRRSSVEVAIPDLAGGDFEHLTITGQLDLITRQAEGASVFIGSSMGGYLACLCAARHPQIEALILLAPAFCLARRWSEWLGGEEMSQWRQTGSRTVFHCGEGRDRQLSYRLIEDGLQYEDYPDAAQPTLIFHGTRDTVVPSSLSEEFVRRRPGTRTLRLLDSGHELSDVTDELWTGSAVFLGL